MSGRFSPRQILLIIFAFCFPIIIVRLVQFQGEAAPNTTPTVVDHLPASTVESRVLPQSAFTSVTEDGQTPRRAGGDHEVRDGRKQEHTEEEPKKSVAAVATPEDGGNEVANLHSSYSSPTSAGKGSVVTGHHGQSYTAGGWDLSEQPTAGEWPERNGGLLAKALETADRKSNGPVELSGSTGCASVTTGVVVDVQQGVFFRGYGGKLNLPTCSIAGVKPISYVYPGKQDPLGVRLESKALKATTNSGGGGGGECAPLGMISQIERPQHAAHMMWSMLSIVSLQVDAGIDYTTTPVHLTMMTYGIFHTWEKDYTDLKKFPHIELLQLLSKKHVGLYVDQNYKRVMISPPVDATSPQAGDRTDCYKHAVVGNIPMRVPRVKNAKYETKASHFQELRRRIISHFNLKVLSMAEIEANPVMLLISRVRQKRRLILNKDNLAEKVRAMGITVREIDWEGMPLREQLQLAINARGMLGVHGNGMAWAPFMPLGSAMLEIGSTWSKRNEVIVGKNEENSANVAKWSGLNALSIRCAYTENEFSKKTSPTRVWKEVDVKISETQFVQIEEFLKPFIPKK